MINHFLEESNKMVYTVHRTPADIVKFETGLITFFEKQIKRIKFYTRDFKQTKDHF